MSQQLDKNTLGYLGIDFQYKLAKLFAEDHGLFSELRGIINPNAFTDQLLRTFIGTIVDYYEENGLIPSYETVSIILNSKARTDTDIEEYNALIKKLKTEVSTEGYDTNKELAVRFFKQQNLIKVANNLLEIASKGDLNRYEECQRMLDEASMAGQDDDLGFSPLDKIEEALSPNYTVYVPTGIKLLDDELNGGLAKKKVGVIIGSAGFGKALADDETVITPDGPKMIKEIKVGDYVIGSNGKPTKVIGVFPQGKRDIYKVTFNDKTSCRCDKEHIWTVTNGTTGIKENLTLGELMERGIEKYYIQYAKPVEYTNNSIGQRISTLNHLMDSYGFCEGDGNAYLRTKSDKIANEVKDIVLSLGGKSYIKDVQSKIPYHKVYVTFFEGSGINVFGRYEKLQSITKYETDENSKKFFENVEFDKNQDAICIKVDAEDELFLTNDYIVTHNTTMSTAIASFASTYKCEANNYDGFKVLQIYFEDDDIDMVRKHISKKTMVESCKLTKSQEGVERIREILEKLPDKELLRKNLRLKSFKAHDKSATDIGFFIKKLINSGWKPDMVLIDYFECMAPEKGGYKTDSKWDREGITMRTLENIAKELDIAMWVPTQGNKDSMRNDDIVTMDQAGGSVIKVQAASVILSICRSVEMQENNKATLALIKNRGGRNMVWRDIEYDNGTCTISCDSAITYDSTKSYIEDTDKAREENEIKLKRRLAELKNQEEDDDDIMPSCPVVSKPKEEPAKIVQVDEDDDLPF